MREREREREREMSSEANSLYLSDNRQRGHQVFQNLRSSFVLFRFWQGNFTNILQLHDHKFTIFILMIFLFCPEHNIHVINPQLFAKLCTGVKRNQRQNLITAIDDVI